MKIAWEANLMFEELAKNNYQPPFERVDGRRQGGIHEVDRISYLEAKFEVLMTRLNQQAPSVAAPEPDPTRPVLADPN